MSGVDSLVFAVERAFIDTVKQKLDSGVELSSYEKSRAGDIIIKRAKEVRDNSTVSDELMDINELMKIVEREFGDSNSVNNLDVLFNVSGD